MRTATLDLVETEGLPKHLEGLEVLSHPECMGLLAVHQLGRVGVNVGQYPAIFPVNYAMLGDDIVFRSALGAKLTAALEDAVVAFEVDAVERDQGVAWSVLVVGRAGWLADGADRDQAACLPLAPLAPEPHDYFIRLIAERVSGRRFQLPPRA